MNVLYWLAIAAITIVSSSRLTRLWTFDEFPPVKWLNDKAADFLDATEKRRKWQELTYCPYCTSFWFTLAVAGWGYLTDFNDLWFFINGSLAASYLAAILMVSDKQEPTDPVTINQTITGSTD